MATFVQVAPAVGVRAMREARGLTQGQLVTALLKRASQLGVPMPSRESLRVAVSRWENGRLTPSREHLRLLADVLDCAVTDLVDVPAVHQTRRAQPSVPVPPDRVGADFDTILGQMIATDHLNGGAHVLMAMAEAGYRSLREVGAHGDPLPDLLAVAARYAEFIGWLHQDQGRIAKARRWTSDAFDLAVATGDHDLIAYILMRRSAIETDDHAAEDGLLLALSAKRFATNAGTAALAARQIGHAHALSGDRRRSQEAMELAASAVEGGGQSALTVYATVPYMLMEAGAAATLTGDHDRAVGLFEQSLGAWPADEQVRDRTLCTARLALAYGRVGEIDAAASTAVTAQQGLAAAPTPRASATLDEVARLLSRHERLEQVQVFEEARRTPSS